MPFEPKKQTSKPKNPPIDDSLGMGIMPINLRSSSQKPSPTPSGSGKSQLSNKQHPQQTSSQATANSDQGSYSLESRHNLITAASRTTDSLSTSVMLPPASNANDASLQFLPRAAEKRKTDEVLSELLSTKKSKQSQSSQLRISSPLLTTEPGKIYTEQQITAKNTTWHQESIDQHARRKEGIPIPSKEDVEKLGNSPASLNKPAYIYKHTSYRIDERSGAQVVASEAGDILRAANRKGMIAALNCNSVAKTGCFVRDSSGNANRKLTERIFRQKTERDKSEGEGESGRSEISDAFCQSM